MPRVRLTDRFCASVKPVEGQGQIDYFDEQTPGLFLRVAATRKVWGLLYSKPGERKRARATFGAYPGMTLADARGRAIELRAGLDEGRDASAAVAETKSGLGATDITVQRLAELFIADRRQRGRRTADEMERSLKIDVLPVIGTLPVAKLRRIDLSRVTGKIVARGARTQANRTAALLRSFLGWALDAGHLESDPSHRWKPPAEASAPRERAFSADEIRQFWRGLEGAKVSRWTAEILRLCLAMGCRQGEAAGMLRDELDLDRQLWCIPAERSKNGRGHILPLPKMALEILEPVLASHQLPAVFPGPRGLPMQNSGIARAVQRSQAAIGLEKWTAHDLRRTCATQMAELGVSAFDIGLVLNHVSTTKSTVTTSTYIRHDYLREKQAALTLWSDRLAGIVAGADAADVVQLSRARRRYGLHRRKGRAAA